MTNLRVKKVLVVNPQVYLCKNTGVLASDDKQVLEQFVDQIFIQTRTIQEFPVPHIRIHSDSIHTVERHGACVINETKMGRILGL